MSESNDSQKEISVMPEAILSDEEFLEVFRKHFPKIADGSVEIVSMSRDKSHYAVLAVRSRDLGTNAVEACSYRRREDAARLVADLGGEMVTTILWQANRAEFIKSAFYPAEVELDSDQCKARLRPPRHDPDGSLTQSSAYFISRTKDLIAEITGWEISVAEELDFSPEFPIGGPCRS